MERTTPGADMAAFSKLVAGCEHMWTFVSHRKRFVCRGCGVEMADALKHVGRF